MIKTEGPDPTMVVRRAHHHAKGIAPLVDAAYSALVTCPLAMDDHVHVLKQSSNGAESTGLRLADGRQYHFRPIWNGHHNAVGVVVYGRYRYGRREPLAEWRTVEEVRAFFAGLRMTQVRAA
jgi:hypothetical protein